MSDIIERDWYTMKEAVARAHVSRETMRRYMKRRKDKPPFYKIVAGGNCRFPCAEFDDWVTGKSQKAK